MQSQMDNICSICLRRDYNTVNVTDVDEDNITWLTKLQIILPELEQLEEYVICKCCTSQLNEALKFRDMLVNLLTLQKFKQEKKPTDFNEFEYQDNDVEFYTSCSISSDAFTTENHLQEHIWQDNAQGSLPQPQPILDMPSELEPIISKLPKGYIYNCDNCNIGFATKGELLLHTGNHHEQARICLICDKVCSNKEVLRQHMNDEHDIKTTKYVCPNCNKECDSEKYLKNHQIHCKNSETNFKLECQQNQPAEHTKDLMGIFNCSTCNNFYVTKRNLLSHELYCKKSSNTNYDETSKIKLEQKIMKPRGRVPLRKLNCEVCGLTFVYVKLLIAHCSAQHSIPAKTVKPYICDKCPLRFTSLATLKQHAIYIHDKTRSIVCSMCGKTFITRTDLLSHEYTHFNRRNYKCKECDKAFNTNTNLRTHILVVHTDRLLWKYHCDTCDKRFPLKSNFVQHCKRHSGDKQHVCKVCKKPFISSSELKRHVELHTNIRLFKCVPCGTEYKARRSYQSHLAKKHGKGDFKIPTREKRFVCHICPSQFFDKHKLSRHLRSHAGLKPFSCNSCDKKFTDNSYLKHHLKTVHNITN